MNKLLAVLYLLLSLFGVDLADGAEALCRHTLLPGVCAVKPAVRRQLPATLPADCARPPAVATPATARCAPPQPRAIP